MKHKTVLNSPYTMLRYFADPRLLHFSDHTCMVSCKSMNIDEILTPREEGICVLVSPPPSSRPLKGQEDLTRERC